MIILILRKLNATKRNAQQEVSSSNLQITLLTVVGIVTLQQLSLDKLIQRVLKVMALGDCQVKGKKRLLSLIPVKDGLCKA